MSSVPFAGWALKQGGTKSSKFQRRFFVLNSAGTMEYRTGDEEGAQAKGAFACGAARIVTGADIASIELWPKERPFFPHDALEACRLAIITASRTFFIATDSADEAEKLAAALLKFATRANLDDFKAPAEEDAAAAAGAVPVPVPVVAETAPPDATASEVASTSTTTTATEVVVKEEEKEKEGERDSEKPSAMASAEEGAEEEEKEKEEGELGQTRLALHP